MNRKHRIVQVCIAQCGKLAENLGAKSCVVKDETAADVERAKQAHGFDTKSATTVVNQMEITHLARLYCTT
jgi:hypothetical protein